MENVWYPDRISEKSSPITAKSISKYHIQKKDDTTNTLRNQVSQLRSRVNTLNEDNKNLKNEITTLNRLLTTGSRPIALKNPSFKLEIEFQIGSRCLPKDSILLFKLVNITNSFSLLHIKLSEPHRAERNPKPRTNFKMVVSAPRNTFCRMTINKTKIFGEQDVFYIKDCNK